MTSSLEIFLEKVKEAFPDSDPKVAWQMASYQMSEEFCTVRLLDSSSICGLPKKDSQCPYHGKSERDFWRRCEFFYMNGTQCHAHVKTRNLDVVWCISHLNAPKNNLLLRRVGDYIVIKDTPYALSDDMLSIIGKVEASYELKFVLKRQTDQLMRETAKEYNLAIRLEEV